MEAKLNVFYEDLITSLPMEDAIFIAKLQKSNLFPGNLKATVKSKNTSADAAEFFLEQTVYRDLKNGRADSLKNLLSVMDEFSPSLETLATKIKKTIHLDEDSGTCNYYLLHFNLMCLQFF